MRESIIAICFVVVERLHVRLHASNSIWQKKWRSTNNISLSAKQNRLSSSRWSSVSALNCSTVQQQITQKSTFTKMLWFNYVLSVRLKWLAVMRLSTINTKMNNMNYVLIYGAAAAWIASVDGVPFGNIVLFLFFFFNSPSAQQKNLSKCINYCGVLAVFCRCPLSI